MEFPIVIRVLAGEDDIYLDEMFGGQKSCLCLEFRGFICIVLLYKLSAI